MTANARFIRYAQAPSTNAPPGMAVAGLGDAAVSDGSPVDAPRNQTKIRLELADLQAVKSPTSATSTTD